MYLTFLHLHQPESIITTSSIFMPLNMHETTKDSHRKMVHQTSHRQILGHANETILRGTRGTTQLLQYKYTSYHNEMNSEQYLYIKEHDGTVLSYHNNKLYVLDTKIRSTLQYVIEASFSFSFIWQLPTNHAVYCVYILVVVEYHPSLITPHT